MHVTLKTLSVMGLGAALMWGVAGGARAADFCCPCSQSKSISIEAHDQLTASLECAVKCMHATKAKAGKCQAPGTAPAPSAAPAASDSKPRASGNKVSLFSSEDCSGEAKSVTETSARIGTAGLRSYRVDSGEMATAFEKADFGGRHVEPVGVGLCVSPGFDVNAVRIGKQ